ncbi:winged helix-turn-helix transcriptional regulator [Chachezhania antarctica]|uniref:winged helix-turn-helix transcriptional regulator n=1 Tax=Chachezhania antarctica TaxID=2340860 RepID=UPI000EB05A19|nr:helix-turn-helix domain-containing protein [Chachezhania antarctica]|tara:strand:+ start:7737 stop:8153 length:417 start_codon:yes stop_codon:yes gene_type:complete
MKPDTHVLPGHEDPACGPVRNLLQTVGSKWSMLIVAHLAEEPRRFTDLKRTIGGITQKSLTASLRELEKNGLVERAVTPVVPPRVDYRLTPLGETLLGPMKALTDWAVANECAVARARARFETEQAAAATRRPAPPPI